MDRSVRSFVVVESYVSGENLDPSSNRYAEGCAWESRTDPEKKIAKCVNSIVGRSLVSSSKLLVEYNLLSM